MLTKPPPVDDNTAYTTKEPPGPSLRCLYWLEVIETNKYNTLPALHILDKKSILRWFGVYEWEFDNIIYPTLNDLGIRYLRLDLESAGSQKKIPVFRPVPVINLMTCD